MAKKIAMIGAGSVVFCKTLLSDIMATPALTDSQFALMSRTEPKLLRMEAFARRMIKENALKVRLFRARQRVLKALSAQRAGAMEAGSKR